jgi:hypothetical protein
MLAGQGPAGCLVFFSTCTTRADTSASSGRYSDMWLGKGPAGGEGKKRRKKGRGGRGKAW